MLNLKTLPIARYEFEFLVKTPIRTQDYAGSMLRGAFGHALIKAACMTKQNSCLKCPLLTTCPYPSIFQPPVPKTQTLQRFTEIPAPYIIEPKGLGARIYNEGDTFTFTMVLFGKALEQLPLIVYAWQCAFSKEIGKGSGTLKNIYLVTETARESVYKDNRISEHVQYIELLDKTTTIPSECTISISTPLRLQKNGHPLEVENITAERLFIAIAKRLNLMVDFHTNQKLSFNFQSLKDKVESITDSKSLEWFDWKRYSNRQKQFMYLGGVIGQWQFNKLAPELYQLLTVAEYLHLGKNTSFGMGRIHINK